MGRYGKMTKRRITRTLAALLAALTLLSLAACGDVPVVDVDTDSSTTVQQTEEQKKNGTAKTDNKQADAKTGNTKKDDTKKDDTKKDDTKKDDTKKDDAKKNDIKKDDASKTGDVKKKEEKKAEEEAKKVQEEAKKAEDQKKQEEEKKQENTPATNTENTTNNTSKSNTCTISISCNTALNNMDKLRTPAVASAIPSSGTILSTTTVTFTEGESVYDVLQRVCRDNGIQMESSWTATYNSAYVEGINNLYEFDVGSGSGWMYKVNGWFPNYGCSSYELKNGDNICWVYTCNLGDDVGGGYVT